MATKILIFGIFLVLVCLVSSYVVRNTMPTGFRVQEMPIGPYWGEYRNGGYHTQDGQWVVRYVDNARDY